MANPARNRFLLAAAAATALAALLHLGCIVFGPPWYRFFGAGERMAQLAAAGSPYPAIVTAVIAAILLLWSAYALAGAGAIRRLPLARTALCLITAIFLLRGAAGFVLAFTAPGERGVAFWCWSSVVCLGIGVLYLLGTRRAWAHLQ